MSAKEIPAAGGQTPPGDAFPRAADIFDREAFALRLADARRRRARVFAERAAAARAHAATAPLLQPAALPPTPAAVPAAAPAPPVARRRGRWRAVMAGVVAFGVALLLLRPGGLLLAGLPLALPQSGPGPAILAAPGTEATGRPPLPRGLAPARVAARPGPLAPPLSEAQQATDATSWIPKPLARPDDLRRMATVRKRRAAAVTQPPVVRGVERFLGRMGIRPVAPRPAGQRNPER